MMLTITLYTQRRFNAHSTSITLDHLSSDPSGCHCNSYKCSIIIRSVLKYFFTQNQHCDGGRGFFRKSTTLLSMIVFMKQPPNKHPRNIGSFTKDKTFPRHRKTKAFFRSVTSSKQKQKLPSQMLYHNAWYSIFPLELGYSKEFEIIQVYFYRKSILSALRTYFESASRTA